MWRNSAPGSLPGVESVAVAADVDAGAAERDADAVAGAAGAVADTGDDVGFDGAWVSLGCTSHHYRASTEAMVYHKDLISSLALSVANQVRTNFRL